MEPPGGADSEPAAKCPMMDRTDRAPQGPRWNWRVRPWVEKIPTGWPGRGWAICHIEQIEYLFDHQLSYWQYNDQALYLKKYRPVTVEGICGIANLPRWRH